MTEIVQPDVIQSGLGPDGLPDMVEAVAAEASVPIVAGKHPGTALPSRQRIEQPHRRRRELDRAGSSLGVGEAELAGLEVDVRPAQGEDLALAATRQHQKAYRCHRPRGSAAAVEGLVQHLPDPDREYPAFVDGARRCPPEDVGGPDRFMDFLEAVLDPAHEQPRNMVR